jgi:hypothetical protein
VIPAPIDSAAVAGALATTAYGWLNATFPGLDPLVLNRLSNLLGSVPVILIIMVWEIVGKLVGKWHAPFERAVGPFWARWKPFLNPLIGLVLGTAGGNPLIGLLASGLWSIPSGAAKSLAGPSTATGRARAGVGIVLAVLLIPLLASTSRAGQPGEFPLVFQGGVGERMTLQAVTADQHIAPYGWLHATWPVRDHWILRARFEVPLQKDPVTTLYPKAEGKLELGVSFP